jgi:hypothetical protein
MCGKGKQNVELAHGTTVVCAEDSLLVSLFES